MVPLLVSYATRTLLATAIGLLPRAIEQGGVVIAAAFLSSVSFGIARGIVGIAHKLSLKVGDFAVLLG